MRRTAFALLVLLLGAAVLAGCNDDSMTVQPKNNPLTPSSVWSDGTSARPLPNCGASAGEHIERQLFVCAQERSPVPCMSIVTQSFSSSGASGT